MRNNDRTGRKRSERSRSNRDSRGRFESDRFENRNSNRQDSENRFPYSREWEDGESRHYDRGNYGRGGYGSYDDNVENYRNTGRGYGNDPESFESSYGRRARSQYKDDNYGGSTRGSYGYGNNRGQNSGSWGPSRERADDDSYRTNEYGSEGMWDRGQHGTSWGNGSREGYTGNRGKGPRGYLRSDERILEDINDRLSDDDQLDASEIEVKVEKGEVTLTGSVSDRNDKRLAEDLVESVSGVKNVENRIRFTDNGSQASKENSRSAGATKSNERNKIRESVA